MRIILRTDAGTELGRFRNVGEAKIAAAGFAGSLVIATRDGVVLARRF